MLEKRSPRGLTLPGRCQLWRAGRATGALERREDDEKLREALEAVEAAVAGGTARTEGDTSRVALPQVLSHDVARRLETELRARGFARARYRDEPREWGDLWDRLETVMGLDSEEPRVEWDGRTGGRRR